MRFFTDPRVRGLLLVGGVDCLILGFKYDPWWAVVLACLGALLLGIFAGSLR